MFSFSYSIPFLLYCWAVVFFLYTVNKGFSVLTCFVPEQPFILERISVWPGEFMFQTKLKLLSTLAFFLTTAPLLLGDPLRYLQQSYVLGILCSFNVCHPLRNAPAVFFFFLIFKQPVSCMSEHLWHVLLLRLRRRCCTFYSFTADNCSPLG